MSDKLNATCWTSVCGVRYVGPAIVSTFSGVPNGNTGEKSGPSVCVSSSAIASENLLGSMTPSAVGVWRYIGFWSNIDAAEGGRSGDLFPFERFEKEGERKGERERGGPGEDASLTTVEVNYDYLE